MIELKKYFPNLSQDQLKQFKRLVPIYKDWNSKVNLISRRDIENLFINHILHSLSIVNIIKFKDTTSILDVGTGGGFPGIPLAIFFPNVKFTLLDSIGKKIKVVESVSKDLSLSNVTSINDRVENHFEKYDFILSRAVAKTDKFYSLVNNNFNSKSINEINIAIGVPDAVASANLFLLLHFISILAYQRPPWTQQEKNIVKSHRTRLHRPLL